MHDVCAVFVCTAGMELTLAMEKAETDKFMALNKVGG